jgi:hypothetical protein
MALTVEDGTGVSGADSYISLADARTYATSRGLTISSDDTTAEQQLRQGFDYIEARRGDFQGTKTLSTQPNQWPRDGVYVDGVELATNLIPTELQYAQVQIASAVEGGSDLNPVGGSSFVTEEVVGPIETKYSEKVNTTGIPIIRAAEKLIAPFLVSGGYAVATMRA